MILDNYNPTKAHLFVDEKNQVVYYDYSNRIGYYIPKEQMNKYYAFSNRFMISILVAILAVNLFLPLGWSILVAILLDVVLGMFFYKSYLPSLRKNDKVKLEKLQPYKREIKKDENPTKQMIKIVLYFAFSILLVLNVFEKKMLETNQIAFYLSIGAAIFVFIYAIYYVVQVLKK